jgi:imidazolonepropionase
MKIQADLVIHNASELVTLAGPVGRPRVGDEMAELTVIPDGAVAIIGEEIIAIGSYDQIRHKTHIGPETHILDARECLVTPGLVDAHTHLVYAGSREDEFVLKTVDGISYLDIEKQGGGIPLTVTATQAADKDALLRQATPVLKRMLSYGTTTLEAKAATP